MFSQGQILASPIEQSASPKAATEGYHWANQNPGMWAVEETQPLWLRSARASLVSSLSSFSSSAGPLALSAATAVPASTCAEALTTFSDYSAPDCSRVTASFPPPPPPPPLRPRRLNVPLPTVSDSRSLPFCVALAPLFLSHSQSAGN